MSVGSKVKYFNVTALFCLKMLYYVGRHTDKIQNQISTDHDIAQPTHSLVPVFYEALVDVLPALHQCSFATEKCYIVTRP